MHTVAGVVRDAIANGDLQFTAHGPAKVSARRSQLETASQHDVSSQIEDIVFGLWSLVYGSLLLEMTSPSLADIGIVDSRRAIRRNCNALLDGLGWQPLYCPDAYAKWAAHVSQTLVTRFVTLESP